MPYVQRTSAGAICGLYANLQPGFAEEWLDESDPTIVSFLTKPEVVSPQDLIAQFTDADIATIQTAIGSNSSYALLWYSMLAQGDPMVVTNTRFKAGWQALVTLLGDARMTAIADALNLTGV